jgi:hypothetical protein
MTAKKDESKDKEAKDKKDAEGTAEPLSPFAGSGLKAPAKAASDKADKSGKAPAVKAKASTGVRRLRRALRRG